ncbi:MAG: sugar ABC transporter permease [Aggregatilineales bacterium]
MTTQTSLPPKKVAKLSSRKRRDMIFALVLLIPAFVVLGVTVFYPIIDGIRISFLDYTLRTRLNPLWNEFENYIELFQDGDIQQYFRTTLIYVVSVISIEFVIAISLALMLNSKFVPGRNILRGLFMISWVIPNIVAALLWVWLLQPQYGVVNYFMSDLLGIVEPNQNWTQDPNLAMVSIIIATIWRQMPLMLIMFLAGLQSIPDSLLEAARIDGANQWNLVRRIILPLMSPVIATTILLVTINNFQMFVIPWQMTQGGLVDRTTTLAIATYKEAFLEFDSGKGAAIGVMWLLSLVVISAFVNWYISRTSWRKNNG